MAGLELRPQRFASQRSGLPRAYGDHLDGIEDVLKGNAAYFLPRLGKESALSPRMVLRPRRDLPDFQSGRSISFLFFMQTSAYYAGKSIE
jgi:hypothetical protein